MALTIPPTPVKPSSTPTKHKASTGLIVGVSVGSAIVFVAMILFIVWWTRVRRKNVPKRNLVVAAASQKRSSKVDQRKPRDTEVPLKKSTITARPYTDSSPAVPPTDKPSISQPQPIMVSPSPRFLQAPVIQSEGDPGRRNPPVRHIGTGNTSGLLEKRTPMARQDQDPAANSFAGFYPAAVRTSMNSPPPPNQPYNADSNTNPGLYPSLISAKRKVKSPSQLYESAKFSSKQVSEMGD